MSPSPALRIAILATDGVERVELTDPRGALHAEGWETAMVSDHAGEIRTFDHLDPSSVERVDEDVTTSSSEHYDALLLPGGVANPDALRRSPAAVDFVKHFFDAGKPVAAICHAPWLLIEAGVAPGRSLTSWPSLRTDLENAGAQWNDAEVVRDGNLVTSRSPEDLPAFSRAMVGLFRDSRGARQPAGNGLDGALQDSFPASDPPAGPTGPAIAH